MRDITDDELNQLRERMHDTFEHFMKNRYRTLREVPYYICFIGMPPKEDGDAPFKVTANVDKGSSIMLLEQIMDRLKNPSEANTEVYAAGQERKFADLSEGELAEIMASLARMILSGVALKQVEKPLFTLVLWNQEQHGQYVSNCDRASNIKALREMADRLERGEDVRRQSDPRRN